MKLSILSAVAATALGYQTIPEVEYQFFDFISKYGKSYATREEYNYRLHLFQENLNSITQLNEEETGAQFAPNQFTDLSNSEKANLITGFHPSEKTDHFDEFPPAEDDYVNWIDKGAVTEVKNQGQCGSCWAFSVTGTVEGAMVIAGHPLVSLSEQQLLSCDFTSFGCRGGNMRTALGYVQRVQLMNETAFPYEEKTDRRQCFQVFAENKTVTDVVAHKVVNRTEAALRAAIAQGPTSVAVEADKDPFMYYSSGILDTKKCGTVLNHGVLAVGYGTESGKNYVLVKNSWGTTWGDQGYIKIASATNTCGILEENQIAIAQ